MRISDSQTQPDPAPLFCANCDQQTTLGCSSCQDISYCSMECQQADWPCHGILCSQLSVCRAEHRPTARATRAILFDPQEQYPTFQWIESREDGTLDLSEWFESDWIGQAELVTNAACRPRLVGTQRLAVFSTRVDAPLYRKLLRTLCIEKLSKSRGIAHAWRGPVIAAALGGGDVNMRDFRAIADYFQSNPKNLALMDSSRYKGKPVVGIKINCDDAVELLGVRRAEPVLLSKEMIRQPRMPPCHERLHIFDAMGLPPVAALGPDGTWQEREQPECPDRPREHGALPRRNDSVGS